MFLPFISTAIIYYLIDDLLRLKNLAFRATVKECKSPIYQNLSVYFVYFFKATILLQCDAKTKQQSVQQNFSPAKRGLSY